MIIVEGPDNSGKTTLIDKLSKEFSLLKLVPYKKGPPKNAEDIFMNSWCIINGALGFHSKRVISDRISLISEDIYGPICRKNNLWDGEYFPRKQKLLNSLKTIDPFFIYCRPPDSVVLNFDTHEEKSYDTQEHIKRISESKALILNAYDNYFYRWYNYNFFRYDYTNGKHYTELCQQLKEYLK